MSDTQSIPPWANVELSKLLPGLCGKGEGQTIEFKRALPDQAHAIGRSIAAFASSNRGYLIYGVANDGTIVGLVGSDSPNGRDEVAQRVAGAAKQVRPPVHVELDWAVHDGKTACVITIDRGSEAIYYSNERPMVRRLNVSRPAEPGEVEEVFRRRYASNSTALRLPSSDQIAARMKGALKLMNHDRHEQITVSDLARAMELTSPAHLEEVFEGHVPASFALIDQFCDRFAVNKDWLTSNRDAPFYSTVDHRFDPYDYLELIERWSPEQVYAVRSKGEYGEAILIVQIDPLKLQVIPMQWHVSGHVGGGGSRQLLSMYNLFKHWTAERMNYVVLGRQVSESLIDSISNGHVYPGVIKRMPSNHWWIDLTDVDHNRNTRERLASLHGAGLVAAQDVIRHQLERPHA